MNPIVITGPRILGKNTFSKMRNCHGHFFCQNIQTLHMELHQKMNKNDLKVNLTFLENSNFDVQF